MFNGNENAGGQEKGLHQALHVRYGPGRPTSPDIHPLLHIHHVSPANPRPVGVDDANLLLLGQLVLGDVVKAGAQQGAEEEKNMPLLQMGLIAVTVVSIRDLEWLGATVGWVGR